VLAGAPSAGREREGARVELTLEQGLQLAAERALSRAVSSSRAVSGVAIALDPRTGEILALAVAPAVNPNATRRGGELRNRAVADSFEPGSTMKTFTIAGALDRGALRPLDPIDCGNGRLAVGAHVIHDHAPLGWVGASKVLSSSSNVGAARIGARLGREGLFETLAAFGFGERTGVGLPGEVKGQVPVPRSDIALATQSFGQGLTATALQVTNAMAAIANGGTLMRPLLVRRVVDPATGDVLEEARPEAVRRAVSAETAAIVSRWLVGVVEDEKGTGRRARLDGWRAAGKTGTAQKADPVSGGYSADRHYSSFVGFAPAEAPRIAIGVFVDEPKGEIYGGEVAAPPFREIAEHALKLLGVPPSGPALAAAAPVDAPEPAAAEAAEGPPAVEQAARTAPGGGAGIAVPALAGLPARAAVRTLEALDLAAELRGSGRVVGQSPAPGKIVARGTRVRMTLAPAG
jgi:cell division protein FtsI (penicillin-binding protein 3)